MRYRRAVEKLRLLADECEKASYWPAEEEPFLVSVYAFGDLLEGADPVQAVQIVAMVRLPPEDVPWGSTPQGTEWLSDRLRLSKGGYEHWWRSYLDPAWNHYIRSPVRIFSQDGPDTQTLDALAERRFADLRRLTPSAADERDQVREELDGALRHLRQVRDWYWDDEWRRDHRGFGRHPEHELWDAVYGYLDLLAAATPASPEGATRELCGALARCAGGRSPWCGSPRRARGGSLPGRRAFSPA